MKAKILLCLILILPFLAKAQADNRNRMDHAYKDLIFKQRSPSFSSNENFSGSQYFNKNFSLGKVFVENKEISTNYALRYNAFRDEIEINNDLVIDYLIKDRKISCLIGSDKFVYQIYTDDGNDTDLGYLKVLLEEDKFTLLAKKYKKLKEAKKARTSLTTSFPAKLIDKEKFYYADKSKNIATLIKNNKSLLKLIDQAYSSEMKSFIKENHINSKKESDLLLFFKQYNSLLTKNSQL